MEELVSIKFHFGRPCDVCHTVKDPSVSISFLQLNVFYETSLFCLKKVDVIIIHLLIFSVTIRILWRKMFHLLWRLIVKTFDGKHCSADLFFRLQYFWKGPAPPSQTKATLDQRHSLQCPHTFHYSSTYSILKSSSQQLCPSDSYEIQMWSETKRRFEYLWSLPVHSFNITAEVANKNGKHLNVL